MKLCPTYTGPFGVHHVCARTEHPELEHRRVEHACACGNEWSTFNSLDPEPGAPITVSTSDELDEWYEDAGDAFYFVTDATGQGYVLFCNEDGDWWATRPADDDDQREDGTYPGGVTVHIDELPRPLTIQTQATR